MSLTYKDWRSMDDEQQFYEIAKLLESIAASQAVIAGDITERRALEQAANKRNLDMARKERARLLQEWARLDDSLAGFPESRAFTSVERVQHQRLCNRMDEIGRSIAEIEAAYPDIDDVPAVPS